MKKILAIACVLFSGYASAQVAHPEDPSIVAAIFQNYAVCIENDGSVDPVACGSDSTNSDGAVLLDFFNWKSGGVGWVIGGCGTAPVDPVSSATCPFVEL